MRLSSVVLSTLASVLVAAHPGHDHAAELAERNAALGDSKRNLQHCAAKLAARGLDSRAARRRNDFAARFRGKNLKKKRSAANQKRDVTSLLSQSHESTTKYTADTPLDTVFASNASCVLSPETTEGPYYVAGEAIREDITDDEPGVPLYLDLDVLDMETCEPVTGAYLEIWHCNSTGVYSGVSANGNGNSASDTSNLDATFLRGVQLTSNEGAAQFVSTFPGHYTGRATHIHIMVHLNATAESNGTLIDTTASHVGQLFFDQSLITEVEALSPYTTNQQTLTTNAEDGILSEEAATSDPFATYNLISDDISDGIVAWLSFGINTTLSKSINAAAFHFKEGGYANPNSSGGGPGGSGGPGGPGGPGGNGTAVPSGTGAPTGTGTGNGSAVSTSPATVVTSDAAAAVSSSTALLVTTSVATIATAVASSRGIGKGKGPGKGTRGASGFAAKAVSTGAPGCGAAPAHQ